MADGRIRAGLITKGEMRGALISVMNGVDGSARGGSDDKTEFLSAVETAVAMIVWAEDDFSPIFALVQQ